MWLLKGAGIFLGCVNGSFASLAEGRMFYLLEPKWGKGLQTLGLKHVP